MLAQLLSALYSCKRPHQNHHLFGDTLEEMVKPEPAIGSQLSSSLTTEGSSPIRHLRPSWVNKNIGLLLGARISMSAARAMIAVVFPVYLALTGMSAFQIGLVFFAAAGGAALISVGVGALSDMLGRKPFLLIVPLLAAFSALLISFTTSTAAFFVAAALGSFGRGGGAGGGMIGPYQPAEQALATESTNASNRNAVFGGLASASSLGALIGGLLIGLLMHHHPGSSLLSEYRPAFLLVALGAATAGTLAIWLSTPTEHANSKRRRTNSTPKEQGLSRYEEHPVVTASPQGTSTQPLKKGFFPRKSRSLLLRLAFTNSLNGAAVGMIGPFVVYWFFRRFGVGPSTMGYLFAITNAASMVSNLSAARFARKWGTVGATVIFRAIQALLLIPLALAPSFVIAASIYLVRMLAQRVALPLRQSYTMAVADPEERARVAALSTLPSQVTSSSTPVLAGYLFDHALLALPFELGSVLQLANTTAFYYFFHDLPPAEESSTSTERSDSVEEGLA